MQPRHPNRTDRGLASLEWLLIIAAVGGLAAVMAVAVQRLLDDATETRADPGVRLLEAKVLAAEVSSRAVTAHGSDLQPDGSPFAALRARCERLASDYPDVIDAAVWTQVPMTDLAPVPTTASTAVENTGTTAVATTAPVTTLGASATTTAAGSPVTRWTCRVTGRSP